MPIRDGAGHSDGATPATVVRASTSRDPDTGARVRQGDPELLGDVVRRATKGDERAWDELVKLFGTMLRSVAQRAGLNAADAADAEQATWVQLMRYADQIREPERIGAWLATTVRRQSQRIAIARARQTLSSDPVADYDSPKSQGDDVEDHVFRTHYDGEIERALRKLPQAYRQLLQLLTSDASPSYEQAAKAMGLPLGSIGPMRLRALGMVRRELGRQYQMTVAADGVPGSTAARFGRRASCGESPRIHPALSTERDSEARSPSSRSSVSAC